MKEEKESHYFWGADGKIESRLGSGFTAARCVPTMICTSMAHHLSIAVLQPDLTYTVSQDINLIRGVHPDSNIIFKHKILFESGEVEISRVFIPMPTAFFETMVFEKEIGSEPCYRAITAQEAIQNHRIAFNECVKKHGNIISMEEYAGFYTKGKDFPDIEHIRSFKPNFDDSFMKELGEV